LIVGSPPAGQLRGSWTAASRCCCRRCSRPLCWDLRRWGDNWPGSSLHEDQANSVRFQWISRNFLTIFRKSSGDLQEINLGSHPVISTKYRFYFRK
jgi:hypothetical protein